MIDWKDYKIDCTYGYIMLLYFFDLKIKGKQAYNTLKRRFYYSLGKSELANASFKNKSVLQVDEGLEGAADDFFGQWHPYISVFKAKISELTELTPQPTE